MAGKPKDGPLVHELAAERYRELHREHGGISKDDAAALMAAELGKKKATVLRYIGNATIDTAPVLDEAPAPPPEPDVIWEQAKILNAERNKRAASRGKATYSIADLKPFAILLSSDEHLDHSGCDLETLEDMASVVRTTDGLYAGLHGDLRDNFIIRKLMSAQMASGHHPKEQLRLVNHYLEMFGAGKILYLVGGNHDNWEESLSGVDTLQSLAQDKRILYDSDQFFIKLKCNGTDYGILARHKWRMNSSYSPTHTCMQATRMGLAPAPPDLVIMGHHHDPAITYWQWYGKRRIAIKTGSAKRHDEYAHKVGYPEGGFMAPVVIFWPATRKMLAFPDYREGAEYLEYLRGRD